MRVKLRSTGIPSFKWCRRENVAVKVALVTLFPEMFAAVTDYGITGRAVEQGLLEGRIF